MTDVAFVGAGEVALAGEEVAIFPASLAIAGELATAGDLSFGEEVAEEGLAEGSDFFTVAAVGVTLGLTLLDGVWEAGFKSAELFFPFSEAGVSDFLLSIASLSLVVSESRRRNLSMADVAGFNAVSGTTTEKGTSAVAMEFQNRNVSKKKYNNNDKPTKHNKTKKSNCYT